MKSIIRRYLYTALSLHLMTLFISAFRIGGGWQGVAYASLILMILTIIVKPLANIIMLPINLITFNLTAWLVHIVLFYIFLLLTPQVTASSWDFPGVAYGPFRVAGMHVGYVQVVVILGVLFVLLTRFIDFVVD